VRTSSTPRRWQRNPKDSSLSKEESGTDSQVEVEVVERKEQTKDTRLGDEHRKSSPKICKRRQRTVSRKGEEYEEDYSEGSDIPGQCSTILRVDGDKGKRNMRNDFIPKAVPESPVQCNEASIPVQQTSKKKTFSFFPKNAKSAALKSAPVQKLNTIFNFQDLTYESFHTQGSAEIMLKEPLPDPTESTEYSYFADDSNGNTLDDFTESMERDSVLFSRRNSLEDFFSRDLLDTEKQNTACEPIEGKNSLGNFLSKDPGPFMEKVQYLPNKYQSPCQPKICPQRNTSPVHQERTASPLSGNDVNPELLRGNSNSSLKVQSDNDVSPELLRDNSKSSLLVQSDRRNSNSSNSSDSSDSSNSFSNSSSSSSRSDNSSSGSVPVRTQYPCQNYVSPVQLQIVPQSDSEHRKELPDLIPSTNEVYPLYNDKSLQACDNIPLEASPVLLPVVHSPLNDLKHRKELPCLIPSSKNANPVDDIKSLQTWDNDASLETPSLVRPCLSLPTTLDDISLKAPSLAGSDSSIIQDVTSPPNLKQVLSEDNTQPKTMGDSCLSKVHEPLKVPVSPQETLTPATKTAKTIKSFLHLPKTPKSKTKDSLYAEFNDSVLEFDLNGQDGRNKIKC